ncbi:ubiquitin-activating enzyme E1 [Chlorella virus XW01]|nr:ubiquitin-activating enzyme E1 [Chlorella virus XW01]
MTTFDKDLFDRQIRTYGEAEVKQLCSSSVGIINLAQSFGAEVGKNLVLSGVKNIYLLDNYNILNNDVEYGFYYQSTDLNKSRNIVIKNKLSELNPYCNIQIVSNLNELKDKCNVIVGLNLEKSLLLQLSKFTRENNIKLIIGVSYNSNGFVFVDAIDFVSSDPIGENHQTLLITENMLSKKEIKNSESFYINNDIFLSKDTPHDYSDGDKVELFNLKGENVEQLEGQYIIKVKNKYCFQIENMLSKENMHSINMHIVSGNCKYIPKSKEFNHLSWENINSSMVEGFNQEEDFKIVNKLLDNLMDFNNQSIPVISVVGSLVSNEVLKLLMNKYSPISQILVYNDESFNKIYKELDYSKIYDDKLLIVGSGAIGCELLKNLVSIGVGRNGLLTITDPDHIEKSNLSRQFLFRNEDISKSKSEVASNRAKEFAKNNNNYYNYRALNKKVSSDDMKFVDELFSVNNIVFNALDNNVARRFVDSLCFKYNLPLFESGTMGMKGNTQPVIPFLTETYSNSNDVSDEKDFPICTIKNFPSIIQHTIHWARDHFEMFSRMPLTFNKFKDDINFVDKLSSVEKNQVIMDIKTFVKYNPSTWKDCVKWSLDFYYENYRDNILQLLYCFPQYHTNDDGSNFWSKGKTAPEPLLFNFTENQMMVIEGFSRIMMNLLNIQEVYTKDELFNFLNILNTNYPEYIIKDKKIAKNDEELQQMKEQKEDDLENFKYKDYHYLFQREFVNQEFEKDNDNNYHVMFITGASNSRAENYKINTVSFDETKGIVGRIIPAIATTTSLVAGLITIEYLKYKAGLNKLDDYKSWFVNLAINTFIAGDPIEMKKIKIKDKEFNGWTKFEETENSKGFTLDMFIKKWSKKLEEDINMVVYDSTILYSDFMDDEQTNLNKNLVDLLKDCGINSNQTVELFVSSDNNDDLPVITYKVNFED